MKINLTADQQKVLADIAIAAAQEIWTRVGKDIAVETIRAIADGFRGDGGLARMLWSAVVFVGLADTPAALDVQKYRIVDDMCEPLKDSDGDGTPDIVDPCVNDPGCNGRFFEPDRVV